MNALMVGDVLGGFCGGYFGRDSYADKRVEAIGADWVVVRNAEDGRPEFFGGGPPDMLFQFVRRTPAGAYRRDPLVCEHGIRRVCAECDPFVASRSDPMDVVDPHHPG